MKNQSRFGVILLGIALASVALVAVAPSTSALGNCDAMTDLVCSYQVCDPRGCHNETCIYYHNGQCLYG